MSRLGTAVPCLHNGWDIFSKTQIHGISGNKNQYDIAVHFENSTYEFRLSIRKVVRFSVISFAVLPPVMIKASHKYHKITFPSKFYRFSGL